MRRFRLAIVPLWIGFILLLGSCGAIVGVFKPEKSFSLPRVAIDAATRD